MAINSNSKGKKGELELSKILREHGYDTRRGQQYCGANGDADVIEIGRASCRERVSMFV